MPIRHWAEEYRPREKLVKQGAKSLSDAELLAIFFRTGVTGCSAVDLSQKLLNQHGGVNGLLDLPLEQFCDLHGMGPAKYVALQAALELACRYLWQQAKTGIALDGPNATRRFLTSRFAQYKHEVFACIWLDSQHRIICFDEIFRGTIDSATVYPREIVKQALNLNAAAVIVSHNHPSGLAEPSLADQSITKRLQEALALIEVRVLDHFVVGTNEVVSFLERGLL